MKLIQLAVVFAVALITTVASGQTDTTFTYQGELKQDGSPANGTFNMEFSLWDAEVGGTPIGGLLRVVPVVDAKFKAELDFGGAAFDNSPRWLEHAVNGVPLSPRTPITRAPYAIQTRGHFCQSGCVLRRDWAHGRHDPTPPWCLVSLGIRILTLAE